MSDTFDVRKAIRSFLDAHDGREPVELAEMFLRMCRKQDLAPLVEDEFKWAIRNKVRAAEADVMSSMPTFKRRTTASLDGLEVLLDMPYRIGDGTARKFGEMTADEHRTRIVMLDAQVAGLRRDIALHERAIVLIEQHAVGCLDEIGVMAVAA